MIFVRDVPFEELPRFAQQRYYQIAKLFGTSAPNSYGAFLELLRHEPRGRGDAQLDCETLLCLAISWGLKCYGATGFSAVLRAYARRVDQEGREPGPDEPGYQGELF